MPSTYRGLPGNIARPAQLNVSASTNTTPISLHVAGHNLTTGDVVDVYGHNVNTSANGRWTITVVDANNFTLNGSVGVAAGLGGHALPRTLGANFQVPSDGDSLNAASVSPLWTALADRTEFLGLGVQSGSYSLWGYYEYHIDGTNSFNNWGNGNSGSQCTFLSTFPVQWLAHDVNLSDVIEIDVGLTALASDGNSHLYLTQSAYEFGGTPSQGRIPGMRRAVSTQINYGGALQFHAMVAVTSFVMPGTNGGEFLVGLWAGDSAGGSDTVALNGDAEVVLKVWRPQ